MSELIQDRPAEWTVSFSCFMGFLRVNNGKSDVGFTKNDAPGHGWLPFGIDLRMVTQVKQYGPDDDSTMLFTEADIFLGVINAPFAQLAPKWVHARLSNAGKTFIPEAQ
jgi:hypothetical protein